jgi:hypothetical protein
VKYDTRKRCGIVTKIEMLFTGSHPGFVWKQLVTVRVEGEKFEWQGDMAWFRTRFSVTEVMK